MRTSPRPAVNSMIEVEELTRRYGDLVAVDAIDFTVHPGEVFGLLGPNGAGKTTTVRMLTGFLRPSNGRARLDGHDVVRQSVASRRLIGVVPEEANVYPDLTVWQNLVLMADLHGVSRPVRRRRGDELLDLFGLSERKRQKGRELSKGLRQRLMICMALVSDPRLLFLDEPTSGLDVASARTIRDLVLSMNRERGITVFLTTHNLEEADLLCHRVAIMNRGRIAAIDTPQALRGMVQARRSVVAVFRDPPSDLLEMFDLGPDVEVEPVACGLRVYTADPGRIAQELAAKASAGGLRIDEINTLAPSLEDVFIHVTTTRGGGEDGSL